MPDCQLRGSPQFWELLDAACEDSLTEEQVELLEGILRSDSRARQLYEAYMQLSLEVHFQVRANAAQQRNQKLLDRLKSPVQTASPGLFSRLPFSKEAMIAIVATASIAVVALALSPLLNWPSGGEADLLVANQASSKDELHVVAECIESSDTSWGNNADELLSGQAFHEGQQLELLSGVARIRFKSGAELLLEGPCEIRLDGTRQASLVRGKLVGYVPERAAGFVVNTPLAKVIDMGTRFGVVCENSSSTEVHVFEGLVRVEPRSDEVPDSLKSVRYAAREAVRLEGQASGAIEVFASSASPYDFRHELPVQGGSLIAHYKFEGNLEDASGNHHRGVLVGDARVENDPERGNVLRVSRGGSGVNIGTVVPVPSFPANCSITFAAWVKQEEKSANAYTCIVQLGTRGLHPIATIGILPGGEIQGYLESDHAGSDQSDVTSAGLVGYSAAFEKWHHVAIVYDREIDLAVFYIDGEKDSSDSIDRTYDSAAYTWQGAAIGAGGYSDGLQSFRGKIDDVRIYSRALTEEEIAGILASAAGSK